jgi:hypothetical protein
MNVAELFVALAVAAAPAVTVEASESGGGKPLTLRSKAAIAATTRPNAAAPFAAPELGGPDLDLLPRRDSRMDQSRSSCEGDNSLCYDPQAGRIVYKPARAFMPDIPGLQRENISVKRDRIVFRYSF